jgi:hypothetical protein
VSRVIEVKPTKRSYGGVDVRNKEPEVFSELEHVNVARISKEVNPPHRAKPPLETPLPKAVKLRFNPEIKPSSPPMEKVSDEGRVHKLIEEETESQTRPLNYLQGQKPTSKPVQEYTQKLIKIESHPPTSKEAISVGMPMPTPEELPEGVKEVYQPKMGGQEPKAQEVRNLFLRLEDASVRMKFLNDKVIVDARFKEDTNVYVSFMDSRKLYESLRALGFNLEVLRVNGMELSPKLRNSHRREERLRSFLGNEERTSKETAVNTDSSSGFSLLL